MLLNDLNNNVQIQSSKIIEREMKKGKEIGKLFITVDRQTKHVHEKGNQDSCILNPVFCPCSTFELSHFKPRKNRK